ncbi:MAG: hypothetical protein CK528_04110 [Alcaligenaceae bacterium]|nr:MAG: hypothetical protein CK528_04110 [Alcaligenaceae bacterium]
MSARLASALAALFFMLLGGAQIWLSFRLPDGLGLSPAEPGPGLFPMLVGSLLLTSATSVLVQTLAAQRVAESTRERFPVDIVLLAALIAGFIFLLPRLGFVVSAFCLLLGTLSLYGMPGWWRRVGTAFVMTAVSYLVFTRGLSVNLPSASWLN